ncbi:hypothetical protein [Streptomyces collinus]
MPDTPARRFSELRSTGLLWLINRVVFHPRGLALALHCDEGGQAYGWSLLPSRDGGPWTYPDDLDTAQYHRAEAALTAALDGRPAAVFDPAAVEPEGAGGVILCASCTVRAATYLNYAEQPLCCTCAQCDCGQIPCARMDPALTCRAALSTEEHGTLRCYFPAGHYRPGRVHEAWTADGRRQWWRDGDPGAVPHQPDGTDGTVRPAPDGRPLTSADGAGRPAPDMPRTERPPAVTSADGSRPGEDGVGVDGPGRAVRDRRAEVRQAIEGAFLTDEPSGIRGLLEHVGIDTAGRCITVAGRCVDPAPPGLLDGPARCSCGLTGELLAVDPAGGHAHAAPAAEDRHPAVIAWGQCWDRAQTAEDQLAAVRDVIADMEHTTGARQWARLLRQAAGETGEDDGSPQAWRRRAVRRALAVSRLTGTITAVCDLAHEDAEEPPGEHGDGYRRALADLRAILTAFGHLDENTGGGADLVHRCTNPQTRAFAEVDDLPIPVVHDRPRKEDAR